jgi:hypothetical protein
MAGILTIQPTWQRAGSRLARTDQQPSILAAFVTGLAMFGLAAHGTCLAVLEESSAPAGERAGADSEPMEEGSHGRIAPVTIDGEPADGARMQPCQR